MRAVEKEEKEKRGCLYCRDYKSKQGKRGCKHDECPYRELDEFETYEDYFKSQGSVFDEFFMEE